MLTSQQPSDVLDFDGTSLLNRLDMEVATDLCASSVFQRLRRITFLGAIDYAVRPVRRHSFLITRFDHSIGVAFLAHRAAVGLGVSLHEIRLATAAGLLHDLGHGPLSHSLEPAFSRAFGIDHHKATLNLLSGQGELGREVVAVLKKHSLSAAEVLSVLEGTHHSLVSKLFSLPVNVDTIEGIHRAASYLRGHELMHSPLLVTDCLSRAIQCLATRDHVDVLDRFWHLKNQTYLELIRSNVGVVSDLMCDLYFTRNSQEFRQEDFFGDDVSIRLRFGELFSALRNLRTTLRNRGGLGWIPATLQFNERRFLVDASARLDGPDTFAMRYTQTKLLRTMVLRTENFKEEASLELSEDPSGAGGVQRQTAF